MEKVKMAKKIHAFTLAEILITLTIIGVIAALTIPNLVSRNKDSEIVNGVLKGYSVLKNAYGLAVAENGDITSWITDDDRVVFNKFADHLKVVKKCNDISDGCLKSAVAVSLTGKKDWWNSLGSKALVLQDGTIISYVQHSVTWSYTDHKNASGKGINCGKFFYDINGHKKPNQLGRDIFVFYLDVDGIYAAEEINNPNRVLGNVSGGNAPYTNPLMHCDISEPGSEQWNGIGCTDWILKTKNVNYLHCSGLNYQNQKCKK